MVSDPRYVPRSFASDASEFARAEVIGWREPASAMEHEQLHAAQLQHIYCYVIRRRARDRYGSLTKYAEVTRQAYDRFSRVIRGEGILRLDDIGLATQHLGQFHDEVHRIQRLYAAPET